MSKRHMPDAHTSHPNVTPLIDIIMCLIIFFILVAKIGVTTGADDVDIPASFLGNPIDDMSNTFTVNVKDQSDPQNITVTALNAANEQDTLLVSGAASGQNQLTNVLKVHRAANDQVKVIIRADSKLAWKYVAPVLDACNDAGIHTIAYNTKEAQR